MLPPPRDFPRASFVSFIASEAYLTARKQLEWINRIVQDRKRVRHSRQSIYSHDVGEHLPRRLFQCTRSCDASLSRGSHTRHDHGTRGESVYAHLRRKCPVCLVL